MKTHVVIDMVYHEDEGNEVFCGTFEECEEFIASQSDYFTYSISRLLPSEIESYNS